MRTINLNFISANNYCFWGLKEEMYYVLQNANSTISIINADPIMPWLVATVSSAYLEVNTQREKIVGLELVCSNLIGSNESITRIKLNPKLPLGID